MGPIRIQLGATNVYVLRERGRAMCIDAGPDYDGAWEQLEAQLAAHDLTPRDVGSVILTHAHIDHAGLAHRWQQAGARIEVGAGDAEMLGWTVARWEQERAKARRAMHGHGVPPQWLERGPMERAGGPRSWRVDRAERWPSPLRMTPVVPDRILAPNPAGVVDGERRAIPTPGHTPGSLCLPDGNHLFTGDHLLPRQVASVGIQFLDEERRCTMPRYVRSLLALHALRESRMWPGHGEPAETVGDALNWSLRYLERRADRLLRRLSDTPASAFELATAVFPHLTREHLGAVMAETIGLLDVLEELDLASIDQADGDIMYRRGDRTLEPGQSIVHGGLKPLGNVSE